jgi:hypothetical protein
MALAEARRELARNRSADPSSDGCLGHAPDYGWLVGVLHYSEVRGVWRLRYAGPDEEDRFGGSVTLVGATPLPSLQNGQTVHVEGQLVDPTSWDPSPAYRLHSIQMLR